MSTVSQSIPVERLWELYAYNPLTGLLYSRKTKKVRKGFFNARRDNLITYYKRKPHCLSYGATVYAWCAGEWASPTVDHIDQNPRNHRFDNLRPATTREQTHNQGYFQGGATYRPDRGKWFARIVVEGKTIHLGTFSSKAEAQAAYQIALKGHS